MIDLTPEETIERDMMASGRTTLTVGRADVVLKVYPDILGQSYDLYREGGQWILWPRTEKDRERRFDNFVEVGRYLQREFETYLKRKG